MLLKNNKLIRLITTFFYLGYVPKMPGTAGSLAGVIIFLFFGKVSTAYVLTTILIIFIGFLSCGAAERVFSEKDPGCIVIDEVSGILLCYCFVPATLFNIIGGFILFRIFDILKPLYINRLQNIKGSAGVMLDDLLAAGYSIVVLQCIGHLKQIFI